MLLTASCSQDHTSTIFDPSGESASAIYFVSEGFAMEYEATATTDEVMVDVYRANATGDVEIPLDVVYSTGAEAFVTAPTVASFKDGDFKTTLAIQFSNISNFVRGVTYTVTFSEGAPSTESIKKLGQKTKSLATDVSYKFPALTVSASLKLEWEPVYILKDWNNLFVDPATLTDDAYALDAAGKKQIQGGVYTYTSFFTGTDDAVELQRAKGTNVFRMINWGGGVAPVMNMDLTNTYTDENGVAHPTFTIPHTFIGYVHSQYGNVYFSDVMTYNPALYANYECFPCYFDIANGVFNFCVIYYDAEGPWDIAGSTKPTETFVLNSGIVVYDYATSAEYKGMTVGPDNAAADASFEVKTGADATGFTYALVSGDISKDFAATAEAIVAGTQADAVAVTELGEKGVTPLVIEALEGGAYTLVVVAHDKDKKLTLDGASALYFYFPGLGGGAKDCEFTATLGSYEALGLEWVDGVGDWSAVAIELASEDLKSLTYFVAAKASIDAVLTEGATAEDILAQYGTALTDEQLATLASAGSIKLPFTGLKANTEQTLLALGTNSFGKSLLVTANGATADYPEYSGKVKLGTYKLSCPWVSESTGTSGVDEATLSIVALPGYKNTVLVTDLLTVVNPTNIYWYAIYDEATGTLTLPGVVYGSEERGSLFGAGALMGFYNAEKTLVYTYFAGDAGNGTEFAMTVNDNGEPVGIADGKGIIIQIHQYAQGYPFETYYAFDSVNTTIVPYVAPSEGEGEGAETASVKKVANKAKVNFGRVPFTSVRITR